MPSGTHKFMSFDGALLLRSLTRLESLRSECVGVRCMSIRSYRPGTESPRLDGRNLGRLVSPTQHLCKREPLAKEAANAPDWTDVPPAFAVLPPPSLTLLAGWHELTTIKAS